MLTHVVLLQPKDGVTEDEVTAILRQVQALQQAVPGIIGVETGRNLNESNNQGYTYGFIMRFTDVEHLRAYAPHPAHHAVSEELQRISQSIIDFDIAQ